MGTREAKVEKHLCDEVEKIGGMCRKWVSPGHSGVPDQLVFFPLIIFLIEVKTLDGVVGPSQLREHKRLKEYHANVRVVYGESGVDDFIDECKKTLGIDD